MITRTSHPKRPTTSRALASIVGLLAVVLSSGLGPRGADALTPNERERAVSKGLRAALEARKDGKFKQAFAVLGSLAQRFGDDARVQHELGVLYAIHGQLKPAAARLAEALRLDPTLYAAQRGLAEVLRADGRCPEATPHYAALADRPRHRPVALRGLALCREAAGDLKGARAALERLARLHGDTATGRWAASYLKTLKATGPLSPEAAEREGLRHFRKKRYAEAAAWFELACGKGPTADRCYRLGVARLGERDFLGAAMAFRHALRLDPKHMPSLSAWPTVARKLRAEGRGGVDVDFVTNAGARPALRVAKALADDDLLLAEQLASEAIRAGSRGRALRWLRAETRLRAGQISRAEQDLRWLLRVRPGLRVAQLALAEVAARRRQLAQARRLAGLPQAPVLPEGRTWPEGVTPNADIAAFLRWRHAFVDHQLKRMHDPGLKPWPAFVPPPQPDPEAIRVGPPPAPTRQRRRRR